MTYKRYLLLTILMATLGAYLFITPVLRGIDATAAPLDIGSLSIILFAGLAVLVYLKLCLFLLHRCWPVLGEYAAEHFERTFKSLFSWQKVCIYLGFLLLLLYAFVLTLTAVL